LDAVLCWHPIWHPASAGRPRARSALWLQTIGCRYPSFGQDKNAHPQKGPRPLSRFRLTTCNFLSRVTLLSNVLVRNLSILDILPLHSPILALVPSGPLPFVTRTKSIHIYKSKLLSCAGSAWSNLLKLLPNRASALPSPPHFQHPFHQTRHACALFIFNLPLLILLLPHSEPLLNNPSPDQLFPPTAQWVRFSPFKPLPSLVSLPSTLCPVLAVCIPEDAAEPRGTGMPYSIPRYTDIKSSIVMSFTDLVPFQATNGAPPARPSPQPASPAMSNGKPSPSHTD
jgi:hypothetical protein